jgi:hypothetical protein
MRESSENQGKTGWAPPSKTQIGTLFILAKTPLPLHARFTVRAEQFCPFSTLGSWYDVVC